MAGKIAFARRSDYAPCVLRVQWTGDDWQRHCRALLAERHQANIQFIPDRDRGDGGLEAYCFDGIGYQCYAPEDSFTVTTQTEAQKRKINTDTAKLTNNRTRTERLLGDVRLSRWVLLTPEFDSSSLVEYARTKSLKIRQDDEAFWCAPDFEIVVSTDEMFATERAALFGALPASLAIDVPYPDEEAVFASTTSGVAESLTEKLKGEPSLAADEVRLSRYRSSVLADYIRGQQQLEELAMKYSTLHERVERRLRSTLQGLSREMEGTEGKAPVIVETLVRRLAEALGTDAPSLGPLLAEELARGAVGQWFVQCPLSFPSPS